MFWRFGFHNGSAIDSLLDKEDVSLEAILDEDDLLQECKAQNTRLIDYFQRVNVLQRLFGYVTGQIESEERGRFKYPYVATEVLCSEIWSIVETCVNEQNQLLVPFWETVLDRSAEEMKTQMIMASHFAKINSVFLTKKPVEMLAFIKSQLGVVENFLRHIETPSFVDLLIRIIQLDEHPEGTGTVDWLSSQNLIGRLIDLLAPHHTCDVHTIVADLIKNIITIATPSPGAGIGDNLQNGPASNCLARELAYRDCISKLMSYILYDFGPGRNVASEEEELNRTEDLEKPTITRLPTLESATSSIVQSISIIIELIRKNNSDYFEPYLFHSLRSRLIQIQQHLHMQTEDGREELERAMQEMVDRTGIVHFRPLLVIMCDRMEELQRLMRSPRSMTGPISTTIGQITPLTLERYRICELFAELLHCSNMSLLNRPPEYDHLYDEQGRLRGGLAALEGLAQVLSLSPMCDRGQGLMEPIEDEVEPALELSVHNASRPSPMFSSDDDMSSDDEPGSSDEDAMEEIAMFDEPQSISPVQEPTPLPPLSLNPPPDTSFDPSPPDKTPSGTPLSRRSMDSSNSRTRLHGSGRSSRRTLSNIPETSLYIGERLKRCFIDNSILTTLMDLFFEFPWNNFLHSTVYDLMHQILTGNVTNGFSRELAITLFRDARLMHRIVEGQKRNDIESAKPKSVRLGYMGHLTLLSEDVLVALERYPPDLKETLIKYAPVPEWDEYVSGQYNETKQRDSSLLGGGKPAVVPSAFPKWQIDEGDVGTFASSASTGLARSGLSSMENLGNGGNPNHNGTGSGGGVMENGLKSEFRRMGGHLSRATTADFGTLPGPAEYEEEEEEDRSSAPRFASYMAQEIHHSPETSFGGGSSSSDEDDEEGGWLSHSGFSLGVCPAPVTTRHFGAVPSQSHVNHNQNHNQNHVHDHNSGSNNNNNSNNNLGPSGGERRPLGSVGSVSVGGFDDVFDPINVGSTFSHMSGLRSPSSAGVHSHTRTHNFNPDDDDNDGFGPFSDTHAIGSGESTSIDGEDPFSFSFSSSISDDGSFDAFGDFGEFQSAPDGEGEAGVGAGVVHEASNVEGEGEEGGNNRGEEQELTPTTPTTTTALSESWAFAGGDEGTVEQRAL